MIFKVTQSVTARETVPIPKSFKAEKWMAQQHVCEPESGVFTLSMFAVNIIATSIFGAQQIVLCKAISP